MVHNVSINRVVSAWLVLLQFGRDLLGRTGLGLGVERGQRLVGGQVAGIVDQLADVRRDVAELSTVGKRLVLGQVVADWLLRSQCV